MTAERSGRVDAVLAAAWPDMTRARVQRLIAGGTVTVNGNPVRKSAVVDVGDEVVAYIPARGERKAPPEGPPLAVLFEDRALVAIDKPSGIAAHAGPTTMGPTVAGWFLARYPSLSKAFDVERPGIVHRLNKDTTGVMMLAKTPRAQSSLSAAFEAKDVAKTYLALCDGVPELPRGVVDGPIGRHPGDRTRMAIVRRGREARTLYEVIASGHGRSFIEARPETGRTHQIRVHLAAIGASVMGDSVYGKGDEEQRQLLHAWRLRIAHPSGGDLEITSPLPDDMREAASEWGLEKAIVRYCAPVSPVRTRDSTTPETSE